MKKNRLLKRITIMLMPLAFLASCGEELKLTLPAGDGVIVDVEYQEIYLGKFNVLARYHNSDNSEYVSVYDGSVTFTVFDKEGQRAPGAVVKGLPGMDPDLEYTADQNGHFIVSKEALPTDGSHMDRTLSVTFNGETEASANNTYVPCKVEVRLWLSGSPYLVENGNGQLIVPVVVQRLTSPSANWEAIPTYLGNLLQVFHLYEVGMTGSVINMVPYEDRVDGQTANLSNQNISIALSLSMYRQVKQTYLDGTNTSIDGYNTATPIWDGDTHYFTVQMESFYGESPILNSVFEMPPIQLIPLPTECVATTLTENANYSGYWAFTTFEGRFSSLPTDLFDGTNPYVDDSLLFNSNLVNNATKAATSALDYFYEPVAYNPDDYSNYTQPPIESMRFYSWITLTSGSTSGETPVAQSNYVAPVSPHFVVSHIYVNSSVSLVSRNWLFKSYSAGKLIKNTLTGTAYDSYNYVITRHTTNYAKSIVIGVTGNE